MPKESPSLGPVLIAGNLVGKLPLETYVGASVTKLKKKELSSPSTFASSQFSAVKFHFSYEHCPGFGGTEVQSTVMGGLVGVPLQAHIPLFAAAPVTVAV